MQGDFSSPTQALDVGSTLTLYVKKTASFRKMGNLLANLGGAKRGLAASTRTLALWLVKSIRKAYTARSLEPPIGVKAHTNKKFGGFMGRISGRFVLLQECPLGGSGILILFNRSCDWSGGRA